MANFCVIGTGPWGRTVAAKIQELGHECESCSARGDDYKMLILRNEIVFVAAHPDVNVAIAEFAIQKGKPVIVEKPVAFSATAVKALLTASIKAKVPFIVDYIHLFDKDLLKIRDGTPHSMSVAMGGDTVRDYSSLHDYGSHAFAVALECFKTPVTAIEVLHPGEAYRLRFGSGMAEVFVGNNWPEKVVKVRAIGQDWDLLWQDSRQNDPLAALLNKVVELHEHGRYWSNGNLAFLVTALLERLHNESPVLK
jgi:predicted dehydrogenase